MPDYTDLTFVDVATGAFELGWRFDDALSPEARAGLDAFAPWGDLSQRLSPARRVRLEAFSIAAMSIAAEDLLQNLADDELPSCLAGLSDALDCELAPRGSRVPREDELEAACGPALFPWGAAIPDGISTRTRTQFTAHRLPTARGLDLAGDPYVVESPDPRSSSATGAIRSAAATHGPARGSRSVQASDWRASTPNS